jgi:cytochrome c1
MEEQIAGKTPFAGLQAPKWPKEMLGDFDAVRLQRGKELYGKFCINCHITIEQLAEAQKSSPPNDAFWHVPILAMAPSFDSVE